MSITIDPEDGDAELFGKLVSDLQTGVRISDVGIYGALKKVTGYTGFSGNAAEQNGHYLALKVDTDDPNDEITVELLGGTLGHPVTLDNDRNIVLKISDPMKQRVRIVASHLDSGNNVVTTTKTLRLNGLSLEN